MGSIDGTNDCTSIVGALKKLLFPQSEKLRVCVTGAAGRMASTLCRRLKRKGHYVIACDGIEVELKGPCVFWDEYLTVDLTVMDDCLKVTRGVDLVFNFATSMGRLGFRELDHSAIKDNNTTIGYNMTEAAKISGVERYFHASIAYINAESQQVEAVARLAERQCPIGFEKPETEVLIERYHKEFGFAGRIGRFYCIYGPPGTWEGGRGEARAAIIDSYAEEVLSLMKSDHCCEPEYIGSLNMHELVVLGSDDHKKLGCARALKDWLRMMCFWIKEPIKKAKAKVKAKASDSSTDGSAEVVGTEAPVELGSPRTADGKE